MKYLIAIGIAFFAWSAQAQYSPAWQSGDTILFAFNKDFKVIDNIRAATYARKAVQLKKNKFWIQDCYASGSPYMQATAEFGDPAFYKNTFYGERTYFFENGDTSKTMMYDKSGSLIGKEVSYYSNGQVEYRIDRSQEPEKRTYYHKNGQLQKDYLSNGYKKEGAYIVYDSLGAVSQEGTYAAGKKVGEWKSYHRNGQRSSVMEYNAEGKLVGEEKHFHKNGKLHYAINYIEGSPQGEVQYRHSNGKLQQIKTYKNGELEGQVLAYDSTGMLVAENNYKKGKEEGVQKEFYANGQLKSETMIENGEQVSYLLYYPGGEIKQEQVLKKKKMSLHYYLNNGEEIEHSELQISPYIKPAHEEALNALTLNAELKPETDRVIYTFNVKQDGSIADIELSESANDYMDSVIYQWLRTVDFEPGSSWKMPSAFVGGLKVSIENGEINGMEMGNFSPIPAKEKVFEGSYMIVEQMPMYPGGEAQLFAYLGGNIIYPDEAKDSGIQGVVYVNFIVDRAGFISKPKIIRGVHPLLDRESIRVVSEMPVWDPGKQRGKAVKVQYNLPIRFSLK